MSLIAWQATVQNEFGNVVASPTITVRDKDGNIASIFDMADAPKANPFVGTAAGFAQFKAYTGRYTIEGVKGGDAAQTWTIDLAKAAEGSVYKEAVSSTFRDIYVDSTQTVYGELVYNTAGTFTLEPDNVMGYIFTNAAFYSSVADTQNLGLGNRYWGAGYINILRPKHINYETGRGTGGAVTQATSKITGVTLNNICGSITTAADALGAGASAFFEVTCSAATAKSAITITLNIASNNYTAQVTGTSSGRFGIQLTNISGGSLSQAVVINYHIITMTNS